MGQRNPWGNKRVGRDRTTKQQQSETESKHWMTRTEATEQENPDKDDFKFAVHRVCVDVPVGSPWGQYSEEIHSLLQKTLKCSQG